MMSRHRTDIDALQKGVWSEWSLDPRQISVLFYRDPPFLRFQLSVGCPEVWGRQTRDRIDEW